MKLLIAALIPTMGCIALMYNNARVILCLKSYKRLYKSVDAQRCALEARLQYNEVISDLMAEQLEDQKRLIEEMMRPKPVFEFTNFN